MKRLIIATGLLAISLITFADDGISFGCRKLKLVLDKKITKIELEQKWATGESVDGVSAALELHGCNGDILDRLILDAPMAKLDPIQLKGVHVPTVLVTVDLTAAAGSYSGPLTMPIQVERSRLQQAKAISANGRTLPINLSITGKSNWKKKYIHGSDNLLFVRCEPNGVDFLTSYLRFTPTRYGWKLSVRSMPGLWEADGEFPSTQEFN